MNKDQTTKMLSTLRAVWSNEEITPEKIEVYHWLLSDFPFDTVMAGVKVHMTRGTFFPKPAELLALIAESAVPAISSGAAWSLVVKQINRHGFEGYANVTFDDPAIAEAVKAVGWRRICLEEDPRGFMRRDFDEALERAQTRQRRDVQDGTAIGAGTVVALDRKAS